MAQRLVRKLCSYCAVDTVLSEDIRQRFSIDDLLKRYNFVSPSPKKAQKCPRCNNSGFKGRTVIAEVIPFNTQLQRRFDEDKNYSDLRSLGARSMFEDGVLKFVEGYTSLEEVLKVVQ